MDNYGTIEGALTYHQARSNTAWIDAQFDDTDRLAALLRASDYIDRKYRSFFSARTFKTGGRAQLREWPRAGFVDGSGYGIGNNEIPIEIVNATYEGALRELQNPGSLSVDVAAQAGQYRQVAIEGAISVTFAGGTTADDYQLHIPAIAEILAPLFLTGAVSSSLSGKSVRT